MVVIDVRLSNLRDVAQLIINYCNTQDARMNTASQAISAMLTSDWHGADAQEFATRWGGVNAQGSEAVRFRESLMRYAEALFASAARYRDAQTTTRLAVRLAQQSIVASLSNASMGDRGSSPGLIDRLLGPKAKKVVGQVLSIASTVLTAHDIVFGAAKKAKTGAVKGAVKGVAKGVTKGAKWVKGAKWALTGAKIAIKPTSVLTLPFENATARIIKRAVGSSAKKGAAKTGVAKATLAKTTLANVGVAKAGVVKAGATKAGIAKAGVAKAGVAKAGVAKVGGTLAKGAKIGAIAGPKGVVVGVAIVGAVVAGRWAWNRLRR